MSDRFDLIVIGSGPGGYVAAIKAAKLGMNTAIIENREIGGTCLNRGCIPTKTLMHSSHLYQEALSLKETGISYEGVSYDMEKIQDKKDQVVNKIKQGILSLLTANKVTVFKGTATIMQPGKVHLRQQSKEQQGDKEASLDSAVSGAPEEEILLEADKILIATGSTPVIPKIVGVELPEVITSDELLNKRSVYRKLLIVGGGVIGIEFASMYRDLGCEVEIIEAMDRILPNMDKELSQSIAMSLKKKGVTIHTKAKVLRIFQDEIGDLGCEYEEKEATQTTKAEGILLAVGRRANTQGLFAPELNPEYEGAAIKVDKAFQTSIPGIYAIGDVIKGRQLAHAASAQGIVAVEQMCMKEPTIDLSVIPSCIYTSPEAAVVGLSEEEAMEAGYRVKTGKYLMLGNSKTVLSDGERGFIKVVCDASNDKILGAQLLCDRATDMVSEFASAIVHGQTYADLSRIIRPHPTYSEGITEALEDVEGMAIHLAPKRR